MRGVERGAYLVIVSNADGAVSSIVVSLSVCPGSKPGMRAL